MKDFSKYLAEAVATFTLVFIGGGAVLMNAYTDGALGLLGIALAHGLVLMTMVYATGHISGGHVNPAVTIGMWITKNIKSRLVVGYIVSQLIGAAVAGYLIKLALPSVPDAYLGLTTLAENVTPLAGVIVEAILTFFLVFVIFGVAVDKRAPKGMYGLAIGLVLTFDILVGGPLTGAAMNPARAFGPALVSGFWNNHWVYWVGSVLGAVVAAWVYTKGIMGKRK